MIGLYHFKRFLEQFFRQSKETAIICTPALIVHKAFENTIINSYKNQINDFLFESISKFQYELIERLLSAF